MKPRLQILLLLLIAISAKSKDTVAARLSQTTRYSQPSALDGEPVSTTTESTIQQARTPSKSSISESLSTLTTSQPNVSKTATPEATSGSVNSGGATTGIASVTGSAGSIYSIAQTSSSNSSFATKPISADTSSSQKTTIRSVTNSTSPMEEETIAESELLTAAAVNSGNSTTTEGIERTTRTELESINTNKSITGQMTTTVESATNTALGATTRTTMPTTDKTPQLQTTHSATISTSTFPTTYSFHQTSSSGSSFATKPISADTSSGQKTTINWVTNSTSPMEEETIVESEPLTAAAASSGNSTTTAGMKRATRTELASVNKKESITGPMTTTVESATTRTTMPTADKTPQPQTTQSTTTPTTTTPITPQTPNEREPVCHISHKTEPEYVIKRADNYFTWVGFINDLDHFIANLTIFSVGNDPTNEIKIEKTRCETSQSGSAIAEEVPRIKCSQNNETDWNCIIKFYVGFGFDPDDPSPMSNAQFYNSPLNNRHIRYKNKFVCLLEMVHVNEHIQHISRVLDGRFEVEEALLHENSSHVIYKFTPTHDTYPQPVIITPKLECAHNRTVYLKHIQSGEEISYLYMIEKQHLYNVTNCKLTIRNKEIPTVFPETTMATNQNADRRYVRRERQIDVSTVGLFIKPEADVSEPDTERNLINVLTSNEPHATLIILTAASSVALVILVFIVSVIACRDKNPLDDNITEVDVGNESYELTDKSFKNVEPESNALDVRPKSATGDDHQSEAEAGSPQSVNRNSLNQSSALENTGHQSSTSNNMPNSYSISNRSSTMSSNISASVNLSSEDSHSQPISNSVPTEVSDQPVLTGGSYEDPTSSLVATEQQSCPSSKSTPFNRIPSLSLSEGGVSVSHLPSMGDPSSTGDENSPDLGLPSPTEDEPMLPVTSKLKVDHDDLYSGLFENPSATTDITSDLKLSFESSDEEQEKPPFPLDQLPVERAALGDPLTLDETKLNETS